MKLGPQYKIAKRLGAPIFRKTQTKSFMLSKERSSASQKKRRGGSDYSRQLIEKQKMRFSYGLTERQFKSYVSQALASTKNPQATLFGFLESRLDSIAYRMGLAGTRRAARQMVSHGHITVNGKRVTIPSYRVAVGDAVAIREGSRDSGLFTVLSEQLKEYRAPSWVLFDPEKREGSLVSAPVFSEQDSAADIGAVFEYYTR